MSKEHVAFFRIHFVMSPVAKFACEMFTRNPFPNMEMFSRKEFVLIYFMEYSEISGEKYKTAKTK